MDEIEKVGTFDGLLSYCNYCGGIVDSLKRLSHVQEDEHKKLTSPGFQFYEDKILQLKADLLSQSEEEFIATKDLVLSCERTLKIVSDEFLKKSEEEIERNKERNCDMENDRYESHSKEKKSIPPMKRILKGVMRTGSLANGLLMQGERQFTLVILCDEIPTYKLLKDLHKCFIDKLSLSGCSRKLKADLDGGHSCIIAKVLNEKFDMECRIAITSQKCRRHPFKPFNEQLPKDPEDMLPRVKCEEMLRVLRRARWFEFKCHSHRHSEVTLKILRDVCRREDTLKPMDDWLLQCLFHKVISSSADSSAINLGGLFQRFFECLSSGILLPDGPVLQDPCEREPTDLCKSLTMQQRLSITTTAQRMLRMIALKQLVAVISLTKEEIDFGLKTKRNDVDVDDGFRGIKRKQSQ